jgi:hypothetical protein
MVYDKMTLAENFTQLRASLGVPLYVEIIIILSWTIWTTWTKVIFDNEATSIARCKDKFKEEFALVTHWAQNKYKP